MQPDKVLGKMLNGFQPAQIVMTANELNLFDAIHETAVTGKEVSSQLSFSLKGTTRLLNALAALGLVTKIQNTYQLNPDFIPYLTEKGSHSMKQWIRLSSELVPVWNNLSEFIRTGKMVKNTMEMLSEDPESMRAFIDAMHDKAKNAPQFIADIIPIGDRNNLLDIGGGPGTYSLEFCKQHPDLKATVFEIPPVAKVAQEYISNYNLEDRVGTQNGDFIKDPLPEGHDLVLIANVLHMYESDDAKILVQKAAAALKPGGRLIIHGFSTDPEGISPVEDVIFSINMGLLTQGGNAHPVPEMKEWMKVAGFKNIFQERINAIPTCVITGVLPA